MYNFVAPSCNHCCSRNATMHFVCDVDLTVKYIKILSAAQRQRKDLF